MLNNDLFSESSSPNPLFLPGIHFGGAGYDEWRVIQKKTLTFCNTKTEWSKLRDSHNVPRLLWSRATFEMLKHICAELVVANLSSMK